MKFNATILIVLDVFLAIAALLSAAVVRFGPSEVHLKLLDSTTIYTTGIFVAVVLFASHLMEVYDPGKNVKKREIAVNIVFGAVTSFFLLSVVYYLDPIVMLGRGVLLLSLCLFVLFQFCWHALYLVGKNIPRFSQRILVLGTGILASQIGGIITSSKRNFALVGYATCNNDLRARDTETSQIEVPQDAVLGNCDDLRDIAIRTQADVIVVALSERRGVFPLRDVLRCKLTAFKLWMPLHFTNLPWVS